MSLHLFIQNLWHHIKAFFDKIPKPLQEAIHIAVLIVENIKKFEDTGVPDIFVHLLPPGLPQIIQDAIKANLPKILGELKLADNCAHLTDPNEIVKCGIATLQQIGGDYNSAFLHDISILLAQVAADGKLSWSDGVLLLEWYYQHHKKTPAPTPAG